MYNIILLLKIHKINSTIPYPSRVVTELLFVPTSQWC